MKPRFVVIEGDEYPVATARCCRDWPVVLGYPIRHCRLCDQVPVIVAAEEPV